MAKSSPKCEFLTAIPGKQSRETAAVKDLEISFLGHVGWEGPTGGYHYDETSRSSRCKGWFVDLDVGVAVAEFIFGTTFISTGGNRTTESLVRNFQLCKGDRVLDIGSGFGGMAFLMAQNHEAIVHGVDITAHNVSVGLEYLSNLGENVQEKVTFENNNIFNCNFSPNSFDFVCSRDTFFYISDKKLLFQKIYTWIKPGGRIAVLDLCEGPVAEHSENYNSWARAWKTCCLTIPAYKSLLNDIGFVDVTCIERNEGAIEDLKSELDKLTQEREAFIQLFGVNAHDFIIQEWMDKVERFVGGESIFGHFTAKRPQTTM